ncbi:hypothetical protein L1987_44231 [Smallanthus sonchifolius]|uniref:Uncharacterized protein n=1 Tax=Smallanthus sonchifolius TaxID=185202 RepID=A0ACB9GNV6_9ASTR|nr:hypothetical protein L1987_44231 [Smallanthus sonchifolius]
MLSKKLARRTMLSKKLARRTMLSKKLADLRIVQLLSSCILLQVEADCVRSEKNQSQRRGSRIGLGG